MHVWSKASYQSLTSHLFYRSPLIVAVRIHAPGFFLYQIIYPWTVSVITPPCPWPPHPKEEKRSRVRHSNRKPLFHIAQSSQLTPTHPTPKTAGAQGQTPSWAPPAYPQSRSLLPPRPSYPSRGSSRQTPSYSRRLCLHRQHLHCPLLWSLRHRSDTAAAA